MSTEIYRPNRSDSIAQLVSALSKAQGQIEGAKKDSDNPFFKSKYADLAAVWDACRQPLSKNELAIIQTVDDSANDGRVCVETLLAHSSGEWISHRIRMKPAKDDPQAIGSAITYARRYGLQSLVGIAPEDDDGNAASGKAGQDRPNPPTNKSKESSTVGAPRRQADGYINAEQRDRFIGLCKKHNWSDEDAKKMLQDFGVFTRSKILVKDYEKVCSLIQNQSHATYVDAKKNPPTPAN